MNSTMNPHTAAASLRLTPSNSPFVRSPTSRSPTKSNRGDEPGLRLCKVIGTTATSANGFDCVPSTRQFAYTAGAAAVVATVNGEGLLTVSQRFFRARPSLAGTSRDAATHWPLSVAGLGESRRQTLGMGRDSLANASPLGTAGRDWSDSPTGKSLTAKDRVKAATSVALSPNGKWIAIGETGYRPRVLLFSNKDDSSETPLAALAEHTFGVHALAFSQDAKYLASLGAVNDGFLYIWNVDDRNGTLSLHASNKCTVVINAIAWMGRCLLTVGLRAVKVWRPDEEESGSAVLTPVRQLSDLGKSTPTNNAYKRPKVLIGKNSLLGDLLDANFVAVTPVTSDKAVVCAESGEICILDDTAKTQLLQCVMKVDFPISATNFDGYDTLSVAGPTGQNATFQINRLRDYVFTPPKRRQTTAGTRFVADQTMTIAMAQIGDIQVEMDSRRMINLRKAENGDNWEIQTHQLPAHSDTVLGVKDLNPSNFPAASFVTFASDGSIRTWDGDGNSCSHFSAPISVSPEMSDVANELKALTPICGSDHLAVGDKYGTLTVLKTTTGDVETQVRAHSTEILDMISFERSSCCFVASGSRDRTVQLFAWRDNKLHLSQTMDEHAGAVNCLLAASGGDTLLSCSTDRTIVVRHSMLRSDEDPASLAFVIVRTIGLKASPCSLCLESSDDEILVSAMDRTIAKYNIRTGQAGFTFKCSDAEGGEATTIGKVLYAHSLNGNPTIIGISSSDKSVRLYSEYGSLIARDWGHTEGVTDALLLGTASGPNAIDAAHTSPTLVTVAADSTIFLWDTAPPATAAVSQSQEPNDGGKLLPPKTFTPMVPPLRKVLSHSELNRFRMREKSMDDYNQSPTPATVLPPPSPPRPKKKSSRGCMAQAPKLEPAIKLGFTDVYGSRRSTRRRSPSPSSPPRHPVKRDARRPSVGLGLRSKSSDNMLNQFPIGRTNKDSSTGANSNNFGSITASSESVCRTLRAYRKKLGSATVTTSSTTTPSSQAQQQEQLATSLTLDTLRELDKEIKLTARMIAEKAQQSGAGKVQPLNEAAVARLLDQASERFVGMLDERIKLRSASNGDGGAAGDVLASHSGDVSNDAPVPKSDDLPGPGVDAGLNALAATMVDLDIEK